MKATLKYGIGRKVTVPMSKDTVANLSEQSTQKAIEALLESIGVDSDGTVKELKESVRDPRAVIEVQSKGKYQPVQPQAPFKETLQNRQNLELQINRPHAGG